LQDVGVDHRRLHVGVPKELLDGADVVAVLEQVRGERVPQRVAAGVFLDAGGANAESQNVTEWAVVNLDAGDYVLICNIPDPASGQPHSALGMVKQISVK